MEGVKGEEQTLASNEVVVPIMGVEEPSRENIQCAGVDPVQFPEIASSSAQISIACPFTSDLLGFSPPPTIIDSKMFKGGEDDDDSGGGGGDEDNVEYEREEDEMTKIKEKQDNKTKFLGLPEFTVLRLLEFTVFICALVVFITSLTAHKLRHCKILNLYTWRWCLLGFVILCGRLMAEWLVNILVFSMEKNILLNKKIRFFVDPLRKSFQTLIWSALVLLVWCLLIMRWIKQPKETANILRYITRGLISCLVGTTFWMMKTLLLMKVAASWVTTHYFDSIKKLHRDEDFLSILWKPPLMESPHGFNNKKNAKFSKKRSHECKASIKPSRKQTKNDIGLLVADEDHVPITRRINNVLDAKQAARKIFRNVAKRDYKYIEDEDLVRFRMNDKEMNELMESFKGVADTGEIKESTLRNWMVNVYKDRQFLSHALDDTEANIQELNNLLAGVLVVLIIVIALLVMEIATTQLMILISSQIAVLAFIFGNACKDAFECVMFVFVRRLYGVGDCCVVEGVQMTVQEVRITKTVFLKNEKEIIVYPNSVLATKPLVNFHRTPPTNYSVEFVINLSTSVEKIKALEDKVKEYIERNGNHWRSKYSIQYKEIMESNKLKMALDVSHSVYFLDDEEKSSQRSQLIFELKNIFEALAIK